MAQKKAPKKKGGPKHKPLHLKRRHRLLLKLRDEEIEIARSVAMAEDLPTATVARRTMMDGLREKAKKGESR